MAAIEFSRARTQPPQAPEHKRLNAQVTRMVNELLLPVAGSREFIPLRCECGVPGCLSPVIIPRARLASVRDDPCVFVVAPGHSVEDSADELLATDLTFALIRYRDIDPILATEAELTDLAYH
jgi:hypothetical protein